MAIRKLRAGRTFSTIDTFIGEGGTIFYDEASGQLKISDGHTPGGHYINLVLSAPGRPGAIKPGAGFQVGIDGTLKIGRAHV